MCVPILRSIGAHIDEFREHAKIYVLFDVTDHDGRIVLINIFISNTLNPTRSLYDFRFKRYGSNSGINVFDGIDLDLWHMLY